MSRNFLFFPFSFLMRNGVSETLRSLALKWESCLRHENSVQTEAKDRRVHGVNVDAPIQHPSVLKGLRFFASFRLFVLKKKKNYQRTGPGSIFLVVCVVGFSFLEPTQVCNIAVSWVQEAPSSAEAAAAAVFPSQTRPFFRKRQNSNELLPSFSRSLFKHTHAHARTYTHTHTRRRAHSLMSVPRAFLISHTESYRRHQTRRSATPDRKRGRRIFFFSFSFFCLTLLSPSPSVSSLISWGFGG